MLCTLRTHKTIRKYYFLESTFNCSKVLFISLFQQGNNDVREKSYNAQNFVKPAPDDGKNNWLN